MRPLLILATSAAVLSGCGGEAGDLLALEVSGGFQPVSLEITVTDDGRGRCDGGPLKPITGQTLLDARELKRELMPLAEQAREFPAAGADQREYVIRMQEGSVTWAEGAQGLPPALGRTVVLERSLESQLCEQSPRGN